MRIRPKRPIQFRHGCLGTWTAPSGLPLTVRLEMTGRKRLCTIDPPLDKLGELDRLFVKQVLTSLLKDHLVEVDMMVLEEQQERRACLR